MRLAVGVIAVGLFIMLVVTTAQRAEADRLRALIAIGVFVAGVIGGSKAADATQQRPEGQGDAGGQPRGVLYKLGNGLQTVTTAKYCISLSSGTCSPCDLVGGVCQIRSDEDDLEIQD